MYRGNWVDNVNLSISIAGVMVSILGLIMGIITRHIKAEKREKTYSYLNMPEYALDSYESIDIWYSGLFDYHVRNARINDASYLYKDVR